MRDFLRRFWLKLSTRERQVFLGASVLVGASLVVGGVYLFAKTTVAVPTSGGTIVYGAAGQPQGINPVLATTETDKTLLRFAFSPLEDLAEIIQPNQEANKWTVRLNKELMWQDGQALTSEDLVFTVQKIQEAQRRSPLFSSWQGVTAERVSEREVLFTLPVPYVFFEDTLKNFFPLPKHLLGSIPVSNWPLSQYNFKPVGNGPYLLASSEVGADGFIRSMEFKKNPNYHRENLPHVSRVVVTFFPTREVALSALNDGKIDVLSDLSPQELQLVKRPIAKINFPLENYYAIFINQTQHPALADRSVREALSIAINRQSIIQSALGESAEPRFTPINIETSSINEVVDGDLRRAESLLDQVGWLENPFGQREKLIRGQVVPLSLNLYVPRVPFLEQTASLIKDSWEDLGVNVVIELRDPEDIVTNTLVTRDFPLLLFGNILSPKEDLYPYWHSSAALHPGLNLSSYQNQTIDEYLSTIRRTPNEVARQSLLKEINEQFLREVPAIFLYSTDFTLATSKHVRGTKPFQLWDPTDHLRRVDEWFVKTTRVFK